MGFKVDRATCMQLQKQLITNSKQIVNVTASEIILHPVFVQKILEKIVIENASGLGVDNNALL